jgi:hypothetical protein
VQRGVELTHGDVDGVELGGGEVGAGDEEEAGDEADAELARLHAGEALDQLGVVAARQLPAAVHPHALPFLQLSTLLSREDGTSPTRFTSCERMQGRC